MKTEIRELIKDAEVIGNVYSLGAYGIDEIYLTLHEGVTLPRGDYVFVKDPHDDLPIVYQVASPFWYKPPFDFEESLIVKKSPIRDEHRKRYKCKCILLGKLSEDGNISPSRYPVPPLSDVHKCPPELVKFVTEPLDEWKIKIGTNPETGNPVYIALGPLVRQSLLIAGSQGTGKTTALLTLIIRSVEANPPSRFLILDWTGEFETLLNYLGSDKAIKVSWESVVGSHLKEKPEMVASAWEGDPRASSKAVSVALAKALSAHKRKGILPTKSSLKDEVDSQKETREPTKLLAKAVIDDTMFDRYPPGLEKSLPELIRKYLVVIVDFSKSEELPNEFELKKAVGAFIADLVWKEAIRHSDFGCIVVSDEGHRICPEGAIIERAWINLATEGGRNRCPLWIVARRLSLVSKKVTTESQQNFICFNVEDVDRRRVEEDIGTTFAGMLGTMAQGECMIKSAAGFRVPGQVIHTVVDKIVGPASERIPAKEVFGRMASSSG